MAHTPTAAVPRVVLTPPGNAPVPHADDRSDADQHARQNTAFASLVTAVRRGRSRIDHHA